VVANDAQDDGKRVHLLSGEIVDIHVESPISVLDRRRSGDRSQQQSIAQQKNGQEHCFPKLSKFVRPVRIPIKSGCLFGQAEAEAETTGHEEVVGEDTHALLSSKSSNSNNEEKQEHTWKDLNWWNYKDASICNQVKNVLHMSSSFDTTKEEPKIRHEEWTTIKRFILGKLTKGNSGSLYVSGVPGSGKSFIVQQAIASSMYSLFGHSTKKKTKVVHINCMTLQDPRRIFNILLEKGFEKQCSSSAYEKDHRYALSHLRKAVSTASKAPKRGPGEMVIIVLDEIDHLFQNQGNVLYDLFSLAEIQSSNVVLIGIANSIDMTLRMLPHLHTIGVQPAMVNFRAYVHSELLSLMQERLHSLEGPVFGEKAIELCSRKIAAESGDMRQCLNAAYAALEIHISHMKASETSQDGASAPSSGIKKFVDLQHMSLALGKCLKLPLINGMRALPQHQQMILCSHALMKTEGEVLLTSLFSKYSELCKSTKICRLAFNEFENACTSLHDQGLVALNKKANLHSKALKLKVKMSDIVFALQGIRFFHTILNSDK
jgi:cell division control protein 6